MRIPALLLALFFAAPASAETLTVICKTSEPWADGQQLCRPAVEYRFKSAGPGTAYKIRAKAPTTHCADVSYKFDLILGTTLRTVASARLAPGASEEIWFGDGIPAGEHKLEIYGFGYTGGCNTGTIGSWAIDVTVVPN
jgi:hypothetical protein